MGKEREKFTYFSFPLRFIHPYKEHQSDTEYKEIDSDRLTMIISYAIVQYGNKINIGNQQWQNVDPKLKAREELIYRYDLAKKLLHLTGGDFDTAFERYKKLHTDFNINENEIYTSIQTDIFFDARERKLPIDILRLHAAVRSLILNRNFCKTYMKVLLHRMYGQDQEKKDKITRYKFNKLLKIATNRGLINVISAGRGYYVTIRYKNTMEFETAIMQRIKLYQARKEEYEKDHKDRLNAGNRIKELKRNSIQ